MSVKFQSKEVAEIIASVGCAEGPERGGKVSLPKQLFAMAVVAGGKYQLNSKKQDMLAARTYGFEMICGSVKSAPAPW